VENLFRKKVSLKEILHFFRKQGRMKKEFPRERRIFSRRLLKKWLVMHNE